MSGPAKLSVFFFFNDTATTEIYTLSLHDALPIFALLWIRGDVPITPLSVEKPLRRRPQLHHGEVHHVGGGRRRSEEHTSELQSRQYLVCRLLLEKKKKKPMLADTTVDS